MHTDEYEISLSRELHVCEKKIERISKTLAGIETKYGMKTEAFVVEVGRENTFVQKEDYQRWITEFEALKKWEALRDQYAALLRLMKI